MFALIGGFFLWWAIAFIGITAFNSFGSDRQERLTFTKECMSKYTYSNYEEELKYSVICSDQWTRKTNPAYK